MTAAPAPPPGAAAADDPFDVRRAAAAPGPLRAFNDAGVLAAADVHVARRLARLAGDDDGDVVLAAALAVRAPRLGHVFADLATARETVAVDREEPVDLSGLPWPKPASWLERLAASPLVAAGEDAPQRRPLRLCGSRLYLDRYWREERRLAADLRALAGGSGAAEADEAVLADGLRRLLGDERGGRQGLAAAVAVLRRLAVVAGGPGTGKTTTVALIVALLCEQAAAAGEAPPLIALAAPTGKAAARLEEAVHAEARRLALAEPVRAHLLGLGASTLHRLLGRRPGSHSRFRHDRANRLPHDVVIVDETSMVALSLMARLVEAVRPGARLVLVGDPGQLTSIEAGAVLGDVVGPAVDGLRMDAADRDRAGRVTGARVEAADPPAGAALAGGIVVLERVHRFGGAIAALADATRRGDAGAVLRILSEGHEDVVWIDADPAEAPEPARIRAAAVAAGRAVIGAARAGDARGALDALGRFRLLCAHRRGPYGAQTWMSRIENWLAAEVDGLGAPGRWYAGRPLLVTANDYELRLFNGDTGVIVQDGPERVAAAFERGGEIARIGPERLGAVDTVYAMTVHKSQGSQFEQAAVLLPPPGSPLLTRELLYTAITRARRTLVLAGAAASVQAAVERPVARASGLRSRLWGADA